MSAGVGVLDLLRGGFSSVELSKDVADALAELIEAAREFSGLYGRLWDLVEPEGSGFLHPESVVKYDEAHKRLSAALTRVQGGQP